MSALHPNIKWAELKDQLYITLDVPDCTKPSISIDKDMMTFSGLSHNKQYECKLDLSGEIDTDGSKYVVNDRNIVFMLKKLNEDRWGKLLKTKNRHVACDWDKWVDSDDEEEGKGFDDMGGMGDISNLMSGMGGGPGGMDMDAMMKQMQAMGMDSSALAGAAGGDDGIDSDDDDGKIC